MGSSSGGRFSTDRSDRRVVWHPPYPEVLKQSRAARTARMTRYLRGQDALWWVADCEQAKSDIAACDRITHALGMRAADPACAEPERNRVDAVLARLERARAILVERKREASHQLRLIGISPLEQAQIRDELVRQQERHCEDVLDSVGAPGLSAEE